MPQAILAELNAMQQIADVVEALTPAERRRVAAWFAEYATQADLPARPTDVELDAADATTDDDAVPQTFDTFGALYEAVAPKTGAQKAAVAGYWMELRGQESWKASEVNKLLKQIDVKVSSISIVLTNAVKAADPMIEQLARLGDGERSRKTFRLTDKGTAFVEDRLA